MSTKNAAFDFLMKDDNLAVALEMSEYLDELQSEMHRRFWPKFNLYMDGKLSASNYKLAWKFRHYPTSKIFSAWQVASFYQPIEKAKQGFLAVRFYQEGKTDGYRLGSGVEWTGLENIQNAELTSLKSILVSLNINLASEPWWVYWGKSDYRLYDENSLRELYLNPDAYVQKIGEYFWSVFEATRTEIEKINKSLL